MLASVINVLVNFVSGTIGAIGYPGIVVLMAIESACIPLPSEIIMPFSGFLVATGKLNLHAVALAGAIGNLLGSIAAYALGFYGGRPLIVRYGKYILIREHELKIADRFFERWGWATVFFTRMMPIVRTYISLPAGISRMNFTVFCVLTFLGSIPWSYLLTYVGFILGENWKQIEKYTKVLDVIVLAVILILIAFFLFRRRTQRANEDA